jgi:hypothetical protein
VTILRHISAERAHCDLSVSLMCALLGVSESGFWAWAPAGAVRPCAPRRLADPAHSGDSCRKQRPVRQLGQSRLLPDGLRPPTSRRGALRRRVAPRASLVKQRTTISPSKLRAPSTGSRKFVQAAGVSWPR